MSLYLKYRPQDFDNLVGQDFIKNTLKQSLDTDSLVSSYLFCGPRGTWKTSSARLLAKWINCQNLVEWNPCNSCSSCEAFLEDRLIDVIEIDAASHTWVDNIREIIEKAQFRPTQANFKVYIIDEVHMLSKWAFNALLKILEEPPSHVKFILATTETHKVPDTIISRCQRYDFKSITSQDIQARLKFIAKKEWITIDQASLEYISRSSKWGLRNAISLFEQLVDDSEIVYDTVEQKLWLTDSDILEKIYSQMLEWDTHCITELHTLASEGKNISVFFTELLSYAKDQLLENLGADNLSLRIYIVDILNDWVGQLKYSFDPEIPVIVMMTKIIGSYKQIDPIIETRTILSQSIQGSDSHMIPQENTSPKIETGQEINTPDSILSHDDVHDIFATESMEPAKKSSSVSHWEDFDRDTYIETLKGLKVKWALIISLKQARNFSLLDDHLEIVLQNNFTLKAMNSGDNIVQLIKWLEKMWIEWKTVKLS